MISRTDPMIPFSKLSFGDGLIPICKVIRGRFRDHFFFVHDFCITPKETLVNRAIYSLLSRHVLMLW